MNHVDYPHKPGYLYDCPACESECYCTPGSAWCVFCISAEEQCELYLINEEDD